MRSAFETMTISELCQTLRDRSIVQVSGYYFKMKGKKPSHNRIVFLDEMGDDVFCTLETQVHQLVIPVLQEFFDGWKYWSSMYALNTTSQMLLLNVIGGGQQKTRTGPYTTTIPLRKTNER